MSDLAAAAKPRLEAQLAELEQREHRISADLSEPVNPDWEEQAVELEGTDALRTQSALVGREIASVRRALARIEDGSYGICVRCGDEIAPERLAVRPEAALCIQCAWRAQ